MTLRRSGIMFLTVLVATSCVSTSAGADVQTVPATLGSLDTKGHEESYWQSAASFRDEAGEWHTERLPDLTQRLIDRHFANKAAGKLKHDCIAVGQAVVDPTPGRPPAPWSFPEAIEMASTVLTGTVTASGPGFIRGLPTQLLEVRVATYVKSPSQSPPSQPSTVYVAYPKARFAVGRYTFCIDAEGKLPAAPDIGSRVALVSLNGSTLPSSDLFVILDRSTDIYWEARDTSVLQATGVIPLSGSGLEAFRTLPDLEAEAERIQHHGPERKP